MDDDEPNGIAIPLSKRKLVLAIFGCVTFVAAGVWMWSIADTQSRVDLIAMKAAGIASIGFFGLCGIYVCIKTLDRRPGLIIDEDGIVDRSSAVAVGRIWWDEVRALRVSGILSQSFVTVEVFDPQAFIDRSGRFGRRIHAANAAMTGSPINIASNSLAIDFGELVRLLTEAYERYKDAD
jgi:hypothetical protein